MTPDMTLFREKNLKVYREYLEALGKKISPVAKRLPVVVGEWNIQNQADGLAEMSQAERDELYSGVAEGFQAAINDCLDWYYWTYKVIMKGLDQECDDAARPLYDRQIDYHILPSDVFTQPERYSTRLENGLIVNGQRYWALIIPQCQYISVQAAKYLSALREHGCEVIFAGEYPQGVTGGKAIDFSSFARYEKTYFCKEPGKPVWLEITDAYEGVELFVNGKSAGIQIVPPFRYDMTELLAPGENLIRIEAATTLERENAKIPTPYGNIWDWGKKSRPAPQEYAARYFCTSSRILKNHIRKDVSA